MNKIIARAGLEPWPKTFQNLRSTRETELFKLTNGNVKAVCTWIGNSPEVAMQHYAQVTEADMKEAAKLTCRSISRLQSRHWQGSNNNRKHTENNGYE